MITAFDFISASTKKKSIEQRKINLTKELEHGFPTHEAPETRHGASIGHTKSCRSPSFPSPNSPSLAGIGGSPSESPSLFTKNNDGVKFYQVKATTITE